MKGMWVEGGCASEAIQTGVETKPRSERALNAERSHGVTWRKRSHDFTSRERSHGALPYTVRNEATASRRENEATAPYRVRNEATASPRARRGERTHFAPDASSGYG